MEQPPTKRPCIRDSIGFGCCFGDLELVKVKVDGGYGFETRIPGGGKLLYPYVDAANAVKIFLVNCKVLLKEGMPVKIVHKSGQVLAHFMWEDRIERQEATDFLVELAKHSPYDMSDPGNQSLHVAKSSSYDIDVKGLEGWGEE